MFRALLIASFIVLLSVAGCGVKGPPVPYVEVQKNKQSQDAPKAPEAKPDTQTEKEKDKE